jgi:hypothetical protein
MAEMRGFFGDAVDTAAEISDALIERGLWAEHYDA